MKRDILLYPNEKLREVSRAVTPDDDIKALCDDLVETMLANGGAGLAAIQVGEPLRVFVVRGEGEEKAVVLINPTWVACSPDPETPVAEAMVTEGCLSFPGFFTKTSRFENVRATYQDVDGVEVTKEFSGIQAQVIQHETEHLDGKLLDLRLNFTQANKLKTHMKQYGRRPQETVLASMGIPKHLLRPQPKKGFRSVSEFRGR